MMRNRNKLLSEKNFDGNWLSSIEKTMATSAFEIIEARLKATQLLKEYLKLINFIKLEINIVGEIENTYENYSQQDKFIEQFQQKLGESRFSDARTKKTSIGVHKSDFCVYHSDKKILASLCSTGEQKIMLIAIILAQTKAIANKMEQKPILLLDEIFAHLDKHHRKMLIEELYKIDLQLWITTTEDFIESELDGDYAKIIL